jgi:hypothetical protein
MAGATGGAVSTATTEEDRIHGCFGDAGASRSMLMVVKCYRIGAIKQNLCLAPETVKGIAS